MSPLVREARLTFSAVSCLRLMLCVAVAAVLTEVLPLGRSYWVVLTVAMVLRPGLGSIFGRALQSSVGILIGAALGGLIVVVGPPEAAFLAPAVILAALLPFGSGRNYGLFLLFLAPLLMVLIDILSSGGLRVQESHVVDVLLGCAIVLAIGYAPWPGTWHANLPRSFARAVDAAADYLVSLLPTSTEASTPAAQARAYRQVDALRTELRRAMTEPEPTRGQALAWRPAADALERLLDAVTAIRTSGRQPPSPAEVAVVNAELRHVATAACSGRSAPQDQTLTTSKALEDVTESVRNLERALESGVLR